jgi:hypothetical protein
MTKVRLFPRLFALQVGLLLFTAAGNTQQVPPNAQKNPFGPGWTCNRGFQNINGKCVAVQVPANAELDILGSGWACQRGFQDLSGKCVAVKVPQNAELDILGHGWVCKRGFQDLSEKCVAIQIPQNAELDILGHGWVCKRGFQNADGKCLVVKIPQNAELNALGNDWSCIAGFKRAGAGCLKMSAPELAEYTKMLQQLQARRNRLLGSGNTYTSEKGAEFSVRVNNADLNCSEGFAGGYDSCEIEVSYSITTNYNGNDDPSARVRCEADVEYTDKNGWPSSQSEDESKTSLIYDQSYRGSLEIDISFFEPAIRVSLTSVTCKITSVN